jgi:hypothetical protein
MVYGQNLANHGPRDLAWPWLAKRLRPFSLVAWPGCKRHIQAWRRPTRRPGCPGGAGDEVASRGHLKGEEVVATSFCNSSGPGTHHEESAAVARFGWRRAPTRWQFWWSASVVPAASHEKGKALVTHRLGRQRPERALTKIGAAAA